MAHTYDTKANLARGRSSSGRDLSFTCGAGATLLVLSIVVDGLTARTGGAPTYNGVALTQASTNAQAVSGETTVELWYLLSPPTGSSLTIHLPDDNNVYFTAEASSYKAQSGYTSALRTADKGTGTGTNPTGPTHTGLSTADVVVAAIGSGATTWNPTGRTGTQLYDIDDGSYGDGGQYLLSPASSQALSWTFGTSDDWAIVSAAFMEVQITVTGTLAGTLSNLTGSITGTVRAEGTLSGTLANVTGSLAGTVSGGSSATFGYTSKGENSASQADTIWATRNFSPASNGTVQSITAYVTVAGPSTFKFALASQDTGVIIAVTEEGSLSSYDGWLTLNTTTNPTITTGTNYILAIWKADGNSTWYYTGGQTNQQGYQELTYGVSWPDPLNINWGQSYQFSIYATYTTGSNVSGVLTGTLANVTGAVSGVHGVAGSAAGILGNVSGNASGWSIVSGTLTGLLPVVTAAIIGAHGVTGSAAGLIGPVTGDLSGLVRVEGSLSGILAIVFGAVTGNHGVAGEAAGVLPNLTGSIIGSFQSPESGVTGALAGILPNLTAEVSGVHGVAGMAAGTLPTLTGNLVGTFADFSSQWKFPTLFSDSGFQYGDYDPGQAAAIAIGCLHIYMKTGDERAGTWARRILDDLRINRQDQDYGGYRSDRRYGWLNALVLQTFGLGVNGVPGQSYRFPAITEDKAHFDALISWIMARAGDEKPNVLNSDLIPFTFSEAGDMWDYAPNYLAMGQMGSLEAVVLMLGGALEHGKIQGDWEWFNRLLAFMVRDNLVVLSPAQIRTVTAACDQAGAANLVRLRYADYDRDSSKYFEARDQAAIDNWGEQALDLDFRYGSTVILEDPGMARLLCSRLLQRLAPPLEAAEVETWLEGVRIELGDTVAVSSDFHGWDREEFTVLGKNLDLGRRRVHLKLSRTMDCADSWAVDAAGSAFDAWAIDLDSSWDDHWDSRAYVY